MKDTLLINDYLTRAENRLYAVEVLMQRSSYPDVVMESQKIVELSSMALLRSVKIEIPRIHDVSDILKQNQDKFPAKIKHHIPQLAKISKHLRRDRELSFYGSEDLTPSEFYKKEDATEAFDFAKWVVQTCGLIK